MDAPTINFAKQRITELSAKFEKKGDGKVTEFAYRDQYGRYRNDDESSLGGTVAKGVGTGVGVAGLAGAGLYLRGKFPGSGRLRGAGNRFRAPGAGFAGAVDTAQLGAQHLAGDARRLYAGAKGVAAGVRGVGTSGKAWLQSLLRRIALKGK